MSFVRVGRDKIDSAVIGQGDGNDMVVKLYCRAKEWRTWAGCWSRIPPNLCKPDQACSLQASASQRSSAGGGQ